MEEEERINEIYIEGNEFLPMSNYYDICKSTVKIRIKKESSEGYGTGFFIKFAKINKPFYCLMTNEHVINKKLIDEKKNIEIFYENQHLKLVICLNKEERIIQNFKNYKTFNIDATLIQILEKDNINEDYFLLPSLGYINGYNSFIGKKIDIIQYPFGGELSLSEAEIKNINITNKKYEFSHLASTEQGSSGSPICLKGSNRVLGIHKSSNIKKKENYGDFIGPINDIINQLKRNGYGSDYYKNGKLKYMGYFKDDKYDGNDGIFYDENGEIYAGGFKNGKKNGIGCIYDNNNNLKYKGTFLDDKLIKKEILENKKSKNDFLNYSKTVSYHLLHPLGNLFGLKCNKCKHLTEKHQEISFGKWKCKDCKDGNNICQTNQ